jgi:hypothetical protein
MNKQDYFSLLPLKRTWLEDIVQTLMKRPYGIGEVDAIALAIQHGERDVGNEPESTVTRTLNNYCINASDEERKVKHPLFKRIAPATYKLLSYPETPDLVEIQNIQFTEPGFKQAWDIFVDWWKSDPDWNTLTKRKKLAVFSQSITEEPILFNLIEAYRGSTKSFNPNL